MTAVPGRCDKYRSREIDGSDTATMFASRLIMKTAPTRTGAGAVGGAAVWPVVGGG